MGNTKNAFGKPVISATPTQTVVDIQAVADFADKFANMRGGTASDRGLLLPAEIRVGMLFSESDTGMIYQALTGGTWRLISQDTGWISLGTLNSGWTATVPAQVRVKNGMVSYSGQLSSTGVGSSPFTTLLPPIARPSLTHAFLAVTTAASLRNAYIAPTGYVDLGAGAVAGIILSAIPSHPAA